MYICICIYMTDLTSREAERLTTNKTATVLTTTKILSWVEGLNSRTDRLTDWPTDRLTDWLTDWLADWLSCEVNLTLLLYWGRLLNVLTLTLLLYWDSLLNILTLTLLLYWDILSVLNSYCNNVSLKSPGLLSPRTVGRTTTALFPITRTDILTDFSWLGNEPLSCSSPPRL